MKKQLLQKQRVILLSLLSLVCAISIQAQTWTAPTLTGSTITTGTTYYMYNVGSNGYLTRGAWWGTQSTVSAQPRLNASTSVIKYTATSVGGSLWTFLYNLDGSDQADMYLCPTNTDPSDGSIYTDAWDVAIRTPNRPWNVVQTDATNNIYSIQVQSTYGGYVASQYVGTAIATESTNMGIANTVRYNRAGGDSYTQWKFVSQADLDLYNARILLDKYMTYAKNKAMDVSSYITTYNAGVTADIYIAAASLLTALGRTDVTASITNPSFETNDFTGWINGGGFAINNSTAPADNGWTKDGTYFAEKWVSSGSNLAVGTLTQTVSGLSSGLYELVVSGHAVQQAGSDPLHTGAYITAGSQSTEVVAGHDDYSISNITVTGSTLDIGYALSGAIACNWTVFDNFKLYYYGAAEVLATQAEKDTLNARIKTATNLLSSTAEGDAPGKYTTANRTTLQNLITSSTTLYTNSSSLEVDVNEAIKDLASAMVTYQNSMNVATNQLADGDYFIKIGGMYVNDPGSIAAADGTDPQIANTGFQSQINIANGSSQIYTIAKISGCDRVTPIERYSFFNVVTSRNLSETPTFQSTWSCSNGGDDPWRSQNIYYNGTNYAIQAAGSSAYKGMWYLKNGNELTSNGIVRTPIAADYIFELIPVSQVATGLSNASVNRVTNFVRNNKVVSNFNLDAASEVSISLYAVNGILIETKKSIYQAGKNEKVLDTYLTSGIYIVKTSIEGKLTVNKIVL